MCGHRIPLTLGLLADLVSRRHRQREPTGVFKLAGDPEGTTPAALQHGMDRPEDAYGESAGAWDDLLQR
jgi:hypothetical protein